MAVVESHVKKGTLRLEGETAGSWIDFSCQPTSVTIKPATDTGEAADSLEMLCGDVLQGNAATTTLTATLEIKAVSDFLNAKGLVAYSWKHAGQTRKFEWIPNGNPLAGNPAGDPNHMWTGTVVITPIEVGGQAGKRLEPDVTWTIASLRTPDAWGGQWVIGTGVAITGLTTPTGGSKQFVFAPTSSGLPHDLATLQADTVVGTAALTAATTAAWATGQFIVLGDGSQAHWSGTAWTVGPA